MNPIGRLCLLFRRVPLGLAVLALNPGVVLAQAGYVHMLSGEATLQDARGVWVAKAGDTFASGTTLKTAGNGHMVVKFEDGQLAALRPATTLRVDRYQYDASNPRASRAAVTLTGGTARFVAGVIGATDPQALAVVAGSLRLFRATDVTLLVDSEGVPGHGVAVNSGLAYVQTSPGSVSDSFTPYSTLSVLVGEGQYTSVQVGRPPLLAGPTSAAPAAVQAAINSLAATVLPANRPVVVATAARAAAAVDQARAVGAAAKLDPGNARLRTAAEAAESNARKATAAASSQSALAYEKAIDAGYLAPQPPASSEKVQAASAPVQPEPTLRFLGCTGSPC